MFNKHTWIHLVLMLVYDLFQVIKKNEIYEL